MMIITTVGKKNFGMVLLKEQLRMS